MFLKFVFSLCVCYNGWHNKNKTVFCLTIFFVYDLNIKHELKNLKYNWIKTKIQSLPTKELYDFFTDLNFATRNTQFTKKNIVNQTVDSLSTANKSNIK